MERESRRDFIKRAAGVVAVACAGPALTREAKAQWFRRGERDEWISIGNIKDFVEGVSQPIEEAYRLPDGGAVRSPRLIAVRQGDTVHVMSSRCTHLGAEVACDGEGLLVCPRHGAQFDAAGNVVKGPARRPLPWYETRITPEGEVQVDLGSAASPPIETESD